jgi:hypothetical protein
MNDTNDDDELDDDLEDDDEDEEEDDAVGTATCLPDGTLHLMLRARGPRGELGEALKVCRPTDADYKSMVKHLGGIRPGELKRIPPFR